MSNLSETKDGEWLVSSPSLRPLNYYKILNELSNENTKLKERNDSLNNRDINLCRIANGIRDENFALKELLKRVVNATKFYHEIKTASVIDYGAWYNIANEINQALGEDK